MRYLVLLSIFIYTLQAITLTKEYRYMASDTDSKASSRTQALKIIKNMAIDEVGSGIATQFSKTQEISDEKMKKELSLSVKNFATSFVQTKILEEKWNGVSYWVKAQVTIDDSAIFEKLRAQFMTLENSSKSKKILSLLKDISTKDKLDKLITHAIELPFSKSQKDNAHLSILKAFHRYRIYDTRYREFLISILSQIEYPSWDIRTLPILSYLSYSKPFDKKEQDVLLHLLSYVEVGSSGAYIKKMLNPNLNICDGSVSVFIGEYLSLLANRQAGLPVYSNIKHEIGGILRIWQGVKDNQKCPLLGLDSLNRFIKKEELVRDITPTQWRDVFKNVMYSYPKDFKVSNDYEEFLKITIPRAKADGRTLDFIQTLYKRTPLEDQRYFDKLFKDDLIKLYSNSKLYDGDIDFAIRHSIIVPDVVFSLDRYYDMILNSEKTIHKTKVIKAIFAYDKHNLLKENYAKFFKVLEFLYTSKDDYSLDILFPILKDMRYDKKIVSFIFKSKLSDNPNLSRKANEYLLSNVKAKELLNIIPSLNTKEKTRLITFISKYKKEGASILPNIKSIFKDSKDRDILYALKWLEKNFKDNGYL